MVYLPTCIRKNPPNVGKYTIHGAYGLGYIVFSEEVDFSQIWENFFEKETATITS